MGISMESFVSGSVQSMPAPERLGDQLLRTHCEPAASCVTACPFQIDAREKLQYRLVQR
jgi:hypothetical protein